MTDSAKPDGVVAGSQPLILTGERSGLLMRTATTARALLCTPTKSSARLLNSNVRVLTVTFYLESISC